MKRLLRLAEEAGVDVRVAVLPEGWDGMWVMSESRIYLSEHLTTNVEQRITLAHELAHLRLGHTTHTHRDEQEADRLAIRLLVTIQDFEGATALRRRMRVVQDAPMPTGPVPLVRIESAS